MFLLARIFWEEPCGRLVSDLNCTKIIGNLYWEQNSILLQRVNCLRIIERSDELRLNISDTSPCLCLATVGRIVRSDMLIAVGRLYLADCETDLSRSIRGF